MDKTNISYCFKGKNVLVVGGSKGIGLGLVHSFHESGACVYYLSRSDISSRVGTHLKVNLLDVVDLEQALEKIESLEIDILINCAAINYSKQHDAIDLSEWDDVFRVNITSVFMICNAVLKSMKFKKFGKIVNVSSIAGRHRSVVSGIHYVSSKSALIGFTRQLAYEVSQFNINVNVVCPSQTKTDMYFDTMTKDKEMELLKNIPLGRIASVDDQIAPIMFLCSDAASYMSGAVVDVNGGQI